MINYKIKKSATFCIWFIDCDNRWRENAICSDSFYSLKITLEFVRSAIFSLKTFDKKDGSDCRLLSFGFIAKMAHYVIFSHNLLIISENLCSAAL